MTTFDKNYVHELNNIQKLFYTQYISSCNSIPEGLQSFPIRQHPIPEPIGFSHLILIHSKFIQKLPYELITT